MKAAQHTVVVIRRGRQKHAHHGGAWKVAYADFVTAMMAFFLVMWLAAQDSRIRQAVAGYFQEPGLLPHETSNSVMDSGRGGIDSSGMPALSGKANGMVATEQKALSGAAEKIKQQLLKVPDVASLREQVEFSVTSEGLRIELVDESGSSFFDSGSSVLRGESERILSVIAQEIGKLQNDVVIEGHTDSHQYAPGDKYTNWELSADRANAARRVMVSEGLHPGQLRTVRGFADTELRVAKDPFDPRNRRVTIVVRSQLAAALESAARDASVAAPGQGPVAAPATAPATGPETAPGPVPVPDTGAK